MGYILDYLYILDLVRDVEECTEVFSATAVYICSTSIIRFLVYNANNIVQCYRRCMGMLCELKISRILSVHTQPHPY